MTAALRSELINKIMESVWSPASGPVQWDKEKTTAATRQTESLADAIIKLFQRHRDEATRDMIIKHMEASGPVKVDPMPDDCTRDMFAGYLTYEQLDLLADALGDRAALGPDEGQNPTELKAAQLIESALESDEDHMSPWGRSRLTEALEILSTLGGG